MTDAALAAATARKPKTRRGRAILRAREPQLVEDAKTALIIRGNKSSANVMTMLRDFHSLRSPLSMLFSRKHAEQPFEDMNKLELLCKKHDHSLFAFGSSSKKRPFRLILGRLFNGKLLDMQEFGVEEFRSMASFGTRNREAMVGAKPLVLFQGSSFETDERSKRSKSLLLDFFSGPKPQRVLLSGMEQVIVCSTFDVNVGETRTAEEKGPPKISVARYRVVFSKSGSKLPRVELEEVGPRFRLVLDRSREPERERWKASIKVPKGTKPKKVKNVIPEPEAGKKRGQIHLGKQDFNQIHTVHHSKSKQKKLRADLDARGKGRAAGDAPDP
eukprot:CAMPEP_0171060148 /NCGR_PEP_ID=MMETSP0766_2-20121228/3647_1 /TAXON_ID=439317 /ORGANISM="Gambierdiscus australes, Strain CAWD 149" /LENGTH=329 /DNA_ID=CAMNT_0011515689 /DNA_START=59 /DNA_END=1048 /DNA_ORIENTATION=+